MVPVKFSQFGKHQHHTQFRVFSCVVLCGTDDNPGKKSTEARKTSNDSENVPDEEKTFKPINDPSCNKQIGEVRSKTRRHYIPKELHDNKKFMNKFGRKFVVDAMNDGNIGRWFNHSCEPNMDIVNCFTYTQDMRFPVLAFFTTKTVKAGTELTWNYGSDYNMDDGEKNGTSDLVECVCGADSCRKNVKFKRHNYNKREENL